MTLNIKALIQRAKISIQTLHRLLLMPHMPVFVVMLALIAGRRPNLLSAR
jgi:hypothetical protein